MPTSTPRSPHAVTAAVVAALLLATNLWAPAHGAVPSQVLPGSDEGAEVVLSPEVLRSDAGRAEVDVALGAAAPGDVVVDLALAEAAVAADGTVTPGPPASDAHITRGGRIRPGEVLRATISDVGNPLLVVATVRPAGSGGPTPAATTLAALVLPGAVGAPPDVDLEEVDGELQGTITAAAPLLVTARLRGEEVVTHPERLVLPGQPVVVTGTPPRWPAPSELVVTDEAGRSTTVAAGGTALTALAIVLVLVAATGVVLVVRRGRRSGVT